MSLYTRNMPVDGILGEVATRHSESAFVSSKSCKCQLPVLTHLTHLFCLTPNPPSWVHTFGVLPESIHTIWMLYSFDKVSAYAWRPEDDSRSTTVKLGTVTPSKREEHITDPYSPTLKLESSCSFGLDFLPAATKKSTVRNCACVLPCGCSRLDQKPSILRKVMFLKIDMRRVMKRNRGFC